MTRLQLPNPYELMWAALGLLITTAGALIQVTVPDSWTVGLGAWHLAGYTFSFQLAGLLVTAYMGGARAAFLSQLAYVCMGLAGFDIFMNGGGGEYVQRPSFGYLLGFLPGAWLCGRLTELQRKSRPQGFLGAGLLGICAVHLTGICFLMLQPSKTSLGTVLLQYSGYTILGQIIVLFVCIIVSLILRAALLY